MPAAKKTFSVLFADDSSEDRQLFKTSLWQTARLQLVAEVANGQQAMDYFEGRDPYGNRDKYPLPDLLLLDLHMPLVDGFEVLARLQARAFDHLTVVLTDSMQPRDIKRALDLGADLFQVKPTGELDRNALALALEKRLVESHAEGPVMTAVESRSTGKLSPTGL